MAAKVLSGTPIVGHPGRVRQEPAALRQREGRGRSGRDPAAGPHRPGRQQVLSARARRRPGGGAIDSAGPEPPAPRLRPRAREASARDRHHPERTPPGAGLQLHGAGRVPHLPGARLPRPDRRRQPAAGRGRDGRAHRQRALTVGGDRGRRGRGRVRRPRHRVPPRAAQVGRQRRDQLRAQAPRRHPHHDGAVHRQPADHGAEQHAAARRRGDLRQDRRPPRVP